jgi:hypothetical protein
MYFSLFIAFLVVASTAAVVVESLPVFYHNRSILWYYGEVAVMAIFTFEFAARCYAHSISWNKFLKFMTGKQHLFDLSISDICRSVGNRPLLRGNGRSKGLFWRVSKIDSL